MTTQEPIRNLLLVTFDCARADVAYRGGLSTLESLRARGVSCMCALSSAPLTPVSHATVLTGLQPPNHGLRHLFREPISNDATLLAAHLARAGLRTGAIISCPGLNKWYGFDRGFEHYDDKIPTLPNGLDALQSADVKYRGLAMKRADAVAHLGIEWLERRRHGERWFLFLHFFDAHWPYEPPAEFGAPLNSYEAELHYSDHHLGRVIARLSELNLLDDTLVVVFGDHGEDLEGFYSNDKGGETLGHPEENGHGCLLYEQTQHVPLVFSNQSLPASRFVEPVGLVDIVPTVSSLLGIPVKGTDGVDLAPVFRGGGRLPSRTLYAETMYPRELVENTGRFPHLRNLQAMWLNANLKVIRKLGDNDSATVFRLNEDPNELDPLPPSTIPIGARIVWPTA